MNKQTRLITQEEYELILKTLRNGYEHSGVIRKPNEKVKQQTKTK